MAEEPGSIALRSTWQCCIRDDAYVIQNIPAPLLSLAREAFDAVISRVDPAEFSGSAVHDQQKDAIFEVLPSFDPAAEAIRTTPFVAERYGQDYVGDRLALQFIYQLFPRVGATGLASDAHALWRRFVSELNRPEWLFRGVANLRNFSVAEGLPEVIYLAEGISIRPRSRAALLASGFDDYTCDRLNDDAKAPVWGWSQYVICAESRLAKTPENLLLTGGVTFLSIHP